MTDVAAGNCGASAPRALRPTPCKDDPHHDNDSLSDGRVFVMPIAYEHLFLVHILAARRIRTCRVDKRSVMHRLYDESRAVWVSWRMTPSAYAPYGELRLWNLIDAGEPGSEQTFP